MPRPPAFTAHRLGLIGLVLGAITACGPTFTDSTTDPADPAASLISLSSASLGPEVMKGLAVVRQATAAFHDVGVAIAPGYGAPAAMDCASSPAGAMGVHSVRSGSFDQAVVPTEPEVLLYLPKKNGGFRLVGVEYLVPVLVRNNSTNVVSPWFDATHWGPGYTQVTPPPSVFGEVFEGPMPGHEPGMPWHYDKHVWVWETNPAGMFSQWNPSISCP